MSKMQHKSKVEGRTELPEQAGSPQIKGQPSPATVEPLAKVATNDLTPCCPFCLSVKLEPITFPNPWGRKWVCRDCCSAFREPTTKGKVA